MRNDFKGIALGEKVLVVVTGRYSDEAHAHDGEVVKITPSGQVTIRYSKIDRRFGANGRPIGEGSYSSTSYDVVRGDAILLVRQRVDAESEARRLYNSILTCATTIKDKTHQSSRYSRLSVPEPELAKMVDDAVELVAKDWAAFKAMTRRVRGLQQQEADAERTRIEAQRAAAQKEAEERD